MVEEPGWLTLFIAKIIVNVHRSNVLSVQDYDVQSLLIKNLNRQNLDT